MDTYKFVTKVSGKYTGWTYWIVQYQDGFYAWGYTYRNQFHVSGEDFMFHDDALKAITKRDLSVSIGDSVMF
jgi:hypothetical protein